MLNIALKILLGDRAKYFGLIFGVAFATVLMTQQVSIFIGLILRTASVIYNAQEADLWVMDTRVRYLEEIEPLREIEIAKVRSVTGVQWAVPFYKGLSTIRLPGGLTQQVQVIGVDDVSLIGGCPQVMLGTRESIQLPDHAMMDINGYNFTWPKEPVKLGKYIELNDHRLIINAICDAKPTFFTFPLLYVTYDTARAITPPQRNKLSLILVKAQDGIKLEDLKKRVEHATGLQALTRDEFAWRSISYILERTGIPINFGITIILGIVIGAAITAQTFYIFVLENLKQFGAMKAIGVTNGQLLRMVLTQASLVTGVGYGLGVGATALFFTATKNVPALKGFVLHWQVMLGVALLITIIVLMSILFSLRKVFTIDPAIVFRG
jgi:putative ABC transport system permease protein